MQDVKAALREFILTECLPGESPANLRDDTPLTGGGILDSLAMFHLMAFVEEKFGIEVEAHEAGVDNFQTLDTIASFIQRKRAQAA